MHIDINDENYYEKITMDTKLDKGDTVYCKDKHYLIVKSPSTSELCFLLETNSYQLYDMRSIDFLKKRLIKQNGVLCRGTGAIIYFP